MAKENWLRRGWSWLKAHWRWFLGPVWLLSIVAVWLFHGGERRLLKPKLVPDTAVDENMATKNEAIEQFRARLDTMSQLAEKRLQNASVEQIEAFKEIKDKPISEVAAWIDALS